MTAPSNTTPATPAQTTVADEGQNPARQAKNLKLPVVLVFGLPDVDPLDMPRRDALLNELCEVCKDFGVVRAQSHLRAYKEKGRTFATLHFRDLETARKLFGSQEQNKITQTPLIGVQCRLRFEVPEDQLDKKPTATKPAATTPAPAAAPPAGVTPKTAIAAPKPTAAPKARPTPATPAAKQYGFKFEYEYVRPNQYRLMVETTVNRVGKSRMLSLSCGLLPGEGQFEVVPSEGQDVQGPEATSIHLDEVTTVHSSTPIGTFQLTTDAKGKGNFSFVVTVPRDRDQPARVPIVIRDTKSRKCKTITMMNIDRLTHLTLRNAR